MRFMSRGLFCVFFSVVQLGYSEFVGSPSTSAGIVEKELQQEYQSKPVTPTREVPLLEVDIPEEQLSLEDQEKIRISTIYIEGNEVVSSKELAKVTQEYAGKELSMKDIHGLCQKIQGIYIQKGYFLARAYPPPQEIREEKLTLQIIEGKLGEVVVQGNKHYKTKFILKYFAKYQGKAINYDELLRSVFLLNENADLNAGLVFKKGIQTGTADLVVRVEDKWPCHLYVDENNYGSKQTTLWRTGAQFRYGNLLFEGDTLSLTEVRGNPFSYLGYTNASYSFLLNQVGTSMQLGYTYSSFQVQQLEWLRLRGRTQIGVLELNQALARTRQFSSDLYCSFNYKEIENYQLGNISSNDKLRIFVLGMDFDYTDKFKGRNVADAYISYGIPHFLGGLHTKDPLCSRNGAGGLFAIANVDYTRIQTLPKDCFFMMRGSGQVTPYKLPLAEQLYIGGFDTVRGYPIAAALGDSGYYVNMEVRAAPFFIRDKKLFFSKKKWKDFVQLIGFVDHGGVLLNGGGEDQKKHILLTGAGVGIRVFAPYRLNLSCDVGFPLTEEKKQSSPVFYFKASIQPF